MKVFVINLKRHKDRLNNIEKLMSTYKLSFEIIEAVDGTTLPTETIDRYKNADFLQNIGREISNGEIACNLSHQKTYRKIVEEKLPWALILEDDAFFEQRLYDFLAKFPNNFSSDFPKLLMLTHPIKISQINPITINEYVFYKGIDVFCAHGYMVNLRTALIFSEYFNKIRHVNDDWIRISKNTGVEIYCLLPYLIGHSAFANDSSLELDRKNNEIQLGNYVSSHNSFIKYIKKTFYKFKHKVKRVKEDLTLELHRKDKRKK